MLPSEELRHSSRRRDSTAPLPREVASVSAIPAVAAAHWFSPRSLFCIANGKRTGQARNEAWKALDGRGLRKPRRKEREKGREGQGVWQPAPLDHPLPASLTGTLWLSGHRDRKKGKDYVEGRDSFRVFFFLCGPMALLPTAALKPGAMQII